MSGDLRLRSLHVTTTGDCQKIEKNVALETPITIRVNGYHFATLFATPFQQKQLALGHLLGEGIIKTRGEISKVDAKESEVNVSVSADISERLEAAHAFKVQTTACGSTGDYYEVLDRFDKPIVNSSFQTTTEQIAGMVTQLIQRSVLRKDRTAVHAAGLFVKDNMVAYAEDVGRHNTVDKIIGEAMELGIDFGESVIVTTGRQASDMVLKAARAGVPITVAMRGALYSGIFVAWKTNLTLIAHAHRSSMEIYTYPDRILMNPSPNRKLSASFNAQVLIRSAQSSDVKSDKILDLRHLLCPTLLQELTEALKTVKIGESIEVITADPVTLVDIPAWASREKQQIASTKDDWLTIRFFVKRQT